MGLRVTTDGLAHMISFCNGGGALYGDRIHAEEIMPIKDLGAEQSALSSCGAGARQSWDKPVVKRFAAAGAAAAPGDNEDAQIIKS